MSVVIRQGDTGVHVFYMQSALRGKGYSVAVDGNNGPATVGVVKEFQKQNGLTVDGIAGPATLNKLGFVDMSKKRSVIAAEYAGKHAKPKSVGLCARYVANALVAAGYKFARQPSAFMYATNGVMKAMGFVQIDEKEPYQPGDVVVISKYEGNPHGHIQIFDGHRWYSDFVQRTDNPYRVRHPRTHWRDPSA